MDIPIYSAGRNKYYIHNREQENQPDTVVYDHVKKEIICTNREIFTEKKKKYQEVQTGIKRTINI